MNKRRKNRGSQCRIGGIGKRHTRRRAQDIELDISKGQLASLLGTIPETLSRMHAKMSAQGLIRVQGRQISILDRDGMEDLAAGGKLI